MPTDLTPEVIRELRDAQELQRNNGGWTYLSDYRMQYVFDHLPALLDAAERAQSQERWMTRIKDVAYWRDRALKAEEIARPWIDAGIDLRQKLEAAEKRVRELEQCQHDYQRAGAITTGYVTYQCTRCGRVR